MVPRAVKGEYFADDKAEVTHFATKPGSQRLYAVLFPKTRVTQRHGYVAEKYTHDQTVILPVCQRHIKKGFEFLKFQFVAWQLLSNPV